MTDIARWKRRAARKAEVKGRAQEPSHMFKMCRVVGCRNTARAGTGDGLDTRFCRSHADHYARHGSPYKRSYNATEINPYRRAAVEWLLAHKTDRWVVNAVQRVGTLYANAGQHEEAFRLRGLSPRERATKAWARLREHKVEPMLVVAVWLAVEMIIRDDIQAVDTQEFKHVQAAKLVHRLASGSHKRWPRDGAAAKELHVYPASRGNVLRYIGEDVRGAVELLYANAKGLPVVSKVSAVRAAPRKLAVRRRRA
ncbi:MULTISPECIES: hypothetical protein [Bradyrhizobium]|uniref:hypothetical protein n=1 Tax=Bradyrhizobium TaxID=374 RepID=UPI000425AAD8|nr:MULTISPECIES: hypothetical protein [Bradyrhizobium]MBR1362902.1 hypothetical protein [Bradyrhizobium ottawaense]WQN79976.1 hypothetical protein U7859_23500 [Bradyrhizobium ottawaense]GMO19372.1 hypothetical protein BwSH14_12200 [Bradyrhizobium ottawaense]GMO30531.1 hypothetical protein BwSF21_32200 [Bradyrhizobium ottawaense]GMO41002.1 hypothetical protein BwSF12_43780 [Bradyrhizobium ottawaense]